MANRRKPESLVRARTDVGHDVLDNQCMDIPKIRVIDIERVGGDAVICFQDKRSALFPASFLYALLSQVQELFESELELDDEPQAAQ